MVDHHANPEGTWLIHEAAGKAYNFLGAEKRIGIWFREGGHSHTLEDWRALLDFVDWQFHGLKPSRDFNLNPFIK